MLKIFLVVFNLSFGSDGTVSINQETWLEVPSMEYCVNRSEQLSLAPKFPDEENLYFCVTAEYGEPEHAK